MDINKVNHSASEGQNDAKLGDFLTYAPVLLRAQGRRVVSDSLVMAAADLIPELAFTGLLLISDSDAGNSLVAYRDNRLLRGEETTQLLAQLLTSELIETEIPRQLQIQLLPEALGQLLHADRLYLAPTRTPNKRFGYLLAGCQGILSSTGQQYLKALAELAGIALDNALRFDDLKEAAHDMGLVNEMAASLAASLNGEELFNSFASQLYDIIPVERANLILLPPLATTYNLTFSWNGPEGHTRRLYIKELELADSPYAEAISRQEIITGYWEIAPSESSSAEVNIFEAPFRSQMIIPLIAKRQMVGAVALGSSEAGVYSEEQLRRSLLERLASLFALALLNSRLYEEKQFSAEFDSRIGVYNHDFFDRELANQMHRARRNDHQLGLMMVDMDNLKTVNDQHGHLAGDAALRHVATMIGNTVRTTDIVARYGGDEFGVLLPGCTLLGLEIVAEKTRRAIHNTPLVLPGGQEIPLTVSIGAVLCQDNINHPHDLVKQADAAMYVAKIHRDQVRIGMEAYLPNLTEQQLGQDQAVTNEPDNQPLSQEEYEQVLLSLGMTGGTVEGRVIHELAERLSEARSQLDEATGQITHLKAGLEQHLHLLAELVERREPYLNGGSSKLAKLVRQLGEKTGLSELEIAGLESASCLANLGRLSVPENIWQEGGELDHGEWKQVRQIPMRTLSLISLIRDLLPPYTVEALQYLRERTDGMGYPKELAGEEIPKAARGAGLSLGAGGHDAGSAFPAQVIAGRMSQTTGTRGRASMGKRAN